MQGLTGKLSGKMGSAVFRVRNGAQVVTQYNPIVKNPTTAGQHEVRAMFKLLSQLSAIMESGFGTMTTTKRAGKSAPTQRNAFMQLNYPLVVVDKHSDVPERAKIELDKIQLTKSDRPLGDMTANPDDVVINNIPTGVTAVRFVTVGQRKVQVIDQATGSFIIKVKPEVQKVQDIPVDAESASIGRPAEGSTVLAFGLIPSASGVSKVDFDNVHTPDDEEFIGAVDLDAMVRAGEMVETMTIGLNITNTSA